MFEQAIKAGVLPAVDADFRTALQGEARDADLWTDMMRQTAAAFCREHRRPAVVALAWQCWQVGDQPLACNLLATALDGGEENERLATTLAAVNFLSQTGQPADADARLRPLLEHKDLVKQPALWRTGRPARPGSRADGPLHRVPGAGPGAGVPATCRKSSTWRRCAGTTAGCSIIMRRWPRP